MSDRLGILKSTFTITAMRLVILLMFTVVSLLLLPLPTWAVQNPSQYVVGSCKDLNAQGWGNFPKGDPNYTLRRDHDKNGVACEF
jgi:hypothetical protein